MKNSYVPLSSPTWISNMIQFRDLTTQINKTTLSLEPLQTNTAFK